MLYEVITESETRDAEIQVERGAQDFSRDLAERDVPFDLEIPVRVVERDILTKIHGFAVQGRAEADDLAQPEVRIVAILRIGHDQNAVLLV